MSRKRKSYRNKDARYFKKVSKFKKTIRYFLRIESKVKRGKGLNG